MNLDPLTSHRYRAGHGSESNGTCYIEKVPRECEIKRMRSDEGGEKRDKEKEKCAVSSLACGVSLSMGENSDDDDEGNVRRMALRV